MNRFDEGKNYNDDHQIHIGDYITMYHWSDRTCYHVTEVENQKRIKVKRYYVCADHAAAGGRGHQEWKYFETKDAMNKYLDAYFPGTYTEHEEEPEAETWVYRYNKWMRETTHTKENYCTDKELKSLEKNGYYHRYSELSGKISFGVRDYFYDWSF